MRGVCYSPVWACWLSGIQAVKHWSFCWQRDAAHSEWSVIHSVLSADVLLRQFGHRKLHVPAVVSYVAIVGAESGIFKTVAPHLGVLVVDWVDEEKDDRDGDDCDSHKSSYEGKVVLCNEIKQATYFKEFQNKLRYKVSPFLSCLFTTAMWTFISKILLSLLFGGRRTNVNHEKVANL